MSRQSQTARILDLFKKEGMVTNAELNRICFRYGARIHELRKEGHIIITNRLSDGLFCFVYKGERQDEEIKTISKKKERPIRAIISSLRKKYDNYRRTNH